MGDYTIRNLDDDVENMAPKFGMAPDVEAHFARNELGTKLVGTTLFRVAPNSRLPFGHRHEDQEEVYVVVEGSGRVKLDDEIVELKKFDAVASRPRRSAASRAARRARLPRIRRPERAVRRSRVLP